MTNFCGLDFGTSNSTIGIWSNDQARLSSVEDNKLTIPSALFFDDESNEISFGRKAIFEYIDGAEGRLMRALKSVLGNSLIHETTRVANKSLTFQEILGHFIKHLKTQAENTLQENIDHVVLGRPVFFVDNDPLADKSAQDVLEKVTRQQGFKSVHFQYEPVAAALTYELSVTSEEIALIIDIGGGTSDFSVIRVSPKGAEKQDRFDDILSNTGVHIGGTDFDTLLSLEKVMPHFGYKTMMKNTFGDKTLEVPSRFFHDLATWQKINFLYTYKTTNFIKDIKQTALQPVLFDRLLCILKNKQGHRLAMETEKAKIGLTDRDEILLNMDFIEQSLVPKITRNDFQNAISGKIETLKQTIENALTMAQITALDIDTVFLTGGSTASPLLRQELLGVIPNARVIEGDRFGSIGVGLTLEAQRRYR